MDFFLFLKNPFKSMAYLFCAVLFVLARSLQYEYQNKKANTETSPDALASSSRAWPRVASAVCLVPVPPKQDDPPPTSRGPHRR
ncbi:hypothetical protein [Herbaspirillum sp. B65]|uniref:hypothetical protein n=1 Tax=Herbaspirillum sp. B65 TaxID=137708 RepID=UPI0011D1A1E5|nr:hypothetical protein [Herbaspirillum sp. B65]